MLRYGVMGVFGAGLLAGGSAVAGLSVDQPGRRSGQSEAACTVFEHAQYAGERWALGRGEAQAFVGPRWNDRISAVDCRPGCALVVHEDANYRGRETRFEGRTAFVGQAWNDRISAISVECRGGGGGGPSWGGRQPACTFYEHADFRGAREDVRAGAQVASIGSAWNDRISSIACRPGCAFIGYEHVEGRGGEYRWTGETRFVGPQWNDRISAYRVQCD